jgi:hypothetical protein
MVPGTNIGSTVFIRLCLISCFPLLDYPTSPLTSEKMSALFQELKLSDGRRIDACKTMLLDWLIAEKQMLQTQQKVFVWGFRAARLLGFFVPSGLRYCFLKCWAFFLRFFFAASLRVFSSSVCSKQSSFISSPSSLFPLLSPSLSLFISISLRLLFSTYHPRTTPHFFLSPAD